MEIKRTKRGMGALLLRSGLKRGRPLALEESLPPLRIRMETLQADAQEMSAFNSVVGWHAEGMHAAYPHILAAPLHMELLLHPTVPIRLLGLVHLENRMCVQRLPKEGERFSMEASISGCRWIRNGLEVTLDTQLETGGEILWSEQSILFSRQHVARGIQKETAESWGEITGRQTTLSLGENLGRRYARVSGDWNPIHITGLLGRAFGFKGHIIHGMWSFSRLLSDCPHDRFEARFRFKKPIYLPSKVAISRSRGAADKEFVVAHCESGETRYLEGWWKELN